jgi:hypothetical protein
MDDHDDNNQTVHGILSKARGCLWAWAVRREESECLTATTANWGRWAPVVHLRADD